MIDLTDAEVRRIIAAVYPTRLEALANAAALWCYRAENMRPRFAVGREVGVFGWLGDRLDGLALANQRRRADTHRHLAAYQRHRNR